MIRRSFYFLLVTVILGGLAGGIAWWSFYALPAFIAQSIQGTPAPVQTVSAEEAKAESWQPEIAGIGTLTASEGIDIAPQVGGVITEVLFESGASVKKGDKLVQLDTATDEADLKNLQVPLANAAEELNRKQQIFDRGFAATADLDGLRTARDQLLALAQIQMPPPPGFARSDLAALRFTPAMVLETVLLACAVTTLASLYPALRASRMVIVDAIRHGR